MNAIRLEVFRLAGLALCGVLWAAGPAAAAEEKPRLAVLTWEARNASPEEAEAVTEQVRAVLTQSGRFVMVDRTLTAKILEEWERQQSGLNEAERAVRVGKLYNVRFIVAGKLIRLDARGWLVSSAMLDTETGVTSGAQTLPHQGEFFPLLGMIPAMTARLAGLETAGPPTTAPPPAFEPGGSAVPQGYLGMRLEPLNLVTAQQFGYIGLNGLLVTDIDAESPAAQAGMRQGALILEANRRPLRTPADFERAIQETGSGKSLLLLVRLGDVTNFLVIKVP